jgi:tripartite-type tricarboxylate transporter receptor subunit TctC
MTELSNMPKDGLHISVTTAGVLAFHELKKPNEEITSITGIRDSIGAFVTHPNSPIKTIDDLERAVQRGDNIKFGYGAPGQRMMLDQFFEFAKPKVEPLMVPYKGGGPVVNDLLGGHIDIAQVPLSIVKQHIDSGALKLLALTKGRPDAYASVPMIENKYPKWKEFDGFAVVVPKGADPQAVKYWNEFLQAYIKDQKVQKDFATDLTIPSTFGVKEFNETVQASKKRLEKMEK